jgi:hypothetical protein
LSQLRPARLGRFQLIGWTLAVRSFVSAAVVVVRGQTRTIVAALVVVAAQHRWYLQSALLPVQLFMSTLVRAVMVPQPITQTAELVAILG